MRRYRNGWEEFPTEPCCIYIYIYVFFSFLRNYLSLSLCIYFMIDVCMCVCTFVSFTDYSRYSSSLPPPEKSTCEWLKWPMNLPPLGDYLFILHSSSTKRRRRRTPANRIHCTNTRPAWTGEEKKKNTNEYLWRCSSWSTKWTENEINSYTWPYW